MTDFDARSLVADALDRFGPPPPDEGLYGFSLTEYAAHGVDRLPAQDAGLSD